MCSVGLAVGIASFAGSAMTAVGQHQAQQAAVARSNAIAQQNYQRELQIAAQKSQKENEVYKAEQEAQTAALNNYYATVSRNQAEETRAKASNLQALQETKKESMFKSQTAIRSAIQAQGQVLARGGAGQSSLLSALDADRELGFELAQIEETVYDKTLATAISQEGITLDRAAADAAAWNGLPATPMAPSATLLPVKPIKAQGPSGLALAGNLVSAGARAYGTGYSLDRA